VERGGNSNNHVKIDGLQIVQLFKNLAPMSSDPEFFQFLEIIFDAIGSAKDSVSKLYSRD
jgi:hypothetical protein